MFELFSKFKHSISSFLVEPNHKSFKHYSHSPLLRYKHLFSRLLTIITFIKWYQRELKNGDKMVEYKYWKCLKLTKGICSSSFFFGQITLIIFNKLDLICTLPITPQKKNFSLHVFKVGLILVKVKFSRNN